MDYIEHHRRMLKAFELAGLHDQALRVLESRIHYVDNAMRFEVTLGAIDPVWQIYWEELKPVLVIREWRAGQWREVRRSEGSAAQAYGAIARKALPAVN